MTSETVSGVVEARNERGIRVGAEWFNQSQFRPVQLPSVGAQVRLEVSKGFIRSLEVLEPASAAVDQTPAGVRRTERDETITRLAVLKAAAAFGAARPDCKSADVLLLAERWLQWVNHD